MAPSVCSQRTGCSVLSYSQWRRSPSWASWLRARLLQWRDGFTRPPTTSRAEGNTVEIGNAGTAADDSLIRISTQGMQKSAYMAGIYGNTLTGSAVYLTASGEFGVQTCS